MLSIVDKKQSIKILIAEDDDDDYILAEDTLIELGVPVSNIRRVLNGQELIDYLYRSGGFANQANLIKPDLILLDLNMPIKNGKEALKELFNKGLQQLSIAVLSTSNSQEDIDFCYKNSANSYIVKEGSIAKYTVKMKTMLNYWTSIVELPRSPSFKI
jgi:CheY-like chemotaxis protein